MNSYSQIALLVSQLADNGISWAELKERASQIILFGSRASGDATFGSDWDLLLVSSDPARDIKVKGMDLIWVTNSQIYSEEWLGSELANHIASYGIWLHGVDDWSQSVFVSDASIEAKKTKIRRACHQLLRVHESLDTPFIERRIKTIRRDLQRLMIMSKKRPVPPTPALDREWKKQTECVAYLSAALDAAGVDHRGRVLGFLQESTCDGGRPG